jgi:hypothetical protein
MGQPHDELRQLAHGVSALQREVHSLRQELEQMREEQSLEQALLRQDVATKIYCLRDSLASRHELVQLFRKLHRQVVCLRADSQLEHQRLLQGAGLPFLADGWPDARDWAEGRAMDPHPRPANASQPADQRWCVRIPSAEQRDASPVSRPARTNREAQQTHSTQLLEQPPFTPRK